MESIKVLYVEDDTLDQRNFERLVSHEKLNYTYTLANSIAQAKDLLVQQTFDVALVDYLLTDGTGLELFEVMGQTPIVMVTGSGDEEIAVRAMKAGASDYLIKDPERNYLKILPLTVTKVMKQKQTEDTLRFIQTAQSQYLGYALVDNQLKIELNNPTLAQWIEGIPANMVGQYINQIFPDLVGQESQLCDLLEQSSGMLKISKITLNSANESPRYYDLQIEPYLHKKNYLLIIVINVTEMVQLEQSLLQERNELRLQIAAREKAELALYKANTELEQRVNARTQELSEANTRLKQQINEREQAQKSLSESELRFRAIFENAPVGMSLIDTNYGFIKVNRKICQITGYTEAELLQKTFINITHAEDVDLDVALAQQVFRGARPYYHLEKRFITKQQEAIWVNLIVTALPNQFGQSKYILEMVEDISQRKESQSRLQYQANLLNDVSDAIISTDNDRIIRSWNRAAEQMYGYSPNMVIGKSIAQVIKITKYKNTTLEEAQNRLTFYGNWRGEITVEHAAGHTITVLAAISTVRDAEGKPQGYVALHTDITERIKVEEALKESEAKFRSLAYNSPNIIYIFDLSLNHTTYLNRDLLGYTLEDFQGLEQDMMSKIHPDDFDLAYTHLQEVLGGKENSSPKEYRFLSKSGDWGWVQSRMTILARDVDNHPTHLLGTLTIITSRKKIELALQESEARYRLISELTSDYAYALQINSEGQVMHQWTTQALERITGYTAEEFFDYNGWFKFVHAEDVPTIQARTVRLMSGQFESDMVEFRIYTKTGEMRWLRDHAHPIWDDHEQRVGQIYGASQDITPRKQAQLSLRESEERLRTMVENMPVLMQAIDDQLNIVMWNGEAERTTGYSAAEIIGNPQAHALLYPMAEYRAEVLHELKQRAGNYRELEFTLTNKLDDQRTIAWSDVSAQFQIPGWAYWMVGVDITERKWAEAALAEERASLEQKIHERTLELQQRNSELAEAVQVKNEFLANMTHELRTPLNTILTTSELLQKQFIGSLNERQHNYIHQVAQSGHYLLNLVNDVLDLSKLEAGKLSLEIVAVPFLATCESSLEFIQPIAAKKNLALTYELDKRVQFIQADSHRLKQIIINLLTNAVKFTPSGGKIGLIVEGDTLNQTVNMTVWDTGIGIAPADRDKLFQLFVQLDSGLERQQEGIGLGLALTYRLVKLHGGQLTVTSEVNQGSRFTMTLPWQENPILFPPPLNLATKPLILLAEDNEGNISVLSDFLTISGYDIVIARDGLEAIDQAQTHQPDLILMDIQMPNLNGIEAITQLRTMPLFNQIPIVALTALTTPELDECIHAGANSCLSKPVGLHELLAVVKKALAK